MKCKTPLHCTAALACVGHCNETESSDSDRPMEPLHDGTLQWWAECFPQWKGESNG